MTAWWREHRTAAPELFVEELAAALELIREQPNTPAVHAVTPQGAVRRVLMPKTRSHVYYVHYPAEQRWCGSSPSGALRGASVPSCEAPGPRLPGEPLNLPGKPRGESPSSTP